MSLNRTHLEKLRREAVRLPTQYGCYRPKDEFEAQALHSLLDPLGVNIVLASVQHPDQLVAICLFYRSSSQ